MRSPPRPFGGDPGCGSPRSACSWTSPVLRSSCSPPIGACRDRRAPSRWTWLMVAPAARLSRLLASFPSLRSATAQQSGAMLRPGPIGGGRHLSVQRPPPRRKPGQAPHPGPFSSRKVRQQPPDHRQISQEQRSLTSQRAGVPLILRLATCSWFRIRTASSQREERGWTSPTVMALPCFGVAVWTHAVLWLLRDTLWHERVAAENVPGGVLP